MKALCRLQKANGLFVAIMLVATHGGGYNHKRLNLLHYGFAAAVLGITIVSGLALVSASVFASQVTLTVPANLNVSVTPNVNNGFAETNGTVSISTDSRGGYTLDIRAKDAATASKLVNGSDSINSITEPMTADTYKNTGPVNTWGFRPSSLSSKANLNYIPAPTVDGINIATTTTANAANQANNYDIGLALKVDESVPAKSYSNNYMVTAVAGPDGYSNGSTCKVQDISGVWYAGLCWTWHDFRDGYTWEEAKAASACPNGWHLPTKSQFEALLGAIGSGNQLNRAGWSTGYYWSTTPNGGSAYYLTVNDSSASVNSGNSATNKSMVRCVAQ